jgi:hypothetical protein
MCPEPSPSSVSLLQSLPVTAVSQVIRFHQYFPRTHISPSPSSHHTKRSSLCYFLYSIPLPTRSPFSSIRTLFLNVSILNLSTRHRCLAERFVRIYPRKNFPGTRWTGRWVRGAQMSVDWLFFFTGASDCGCAVWSSFRVTLLGLGSFENLRIPGGWGATSMWEDKSKPLSCRESNTHPSILQASHYIDWAIDTFIFLENERHDLSNTLLEMGRVCSR